MPESLARLADDALGRRARSGDDSAFAALVRRYEAAAFNFAFRFLGDYDDAADVTQQGFVQLFHSLPTLDLSRPLRPWLFRIIRNRCIDVIRQRRTVSLDSTTTDEDEQSDALAGQLVDQGPLPDELSERADIQQLLVAAIMRLPPKYRDVVALRYAADLPFSDIAEVLDIPENTAKIHFHRAKALLRVALRDLQ